MVRARPRAVSRATPWWSTRMSSTCSGASSASAMTRRPRSGCLTSRRTCGESTKPPEAWSHPRGAGVTQLWCTGTVCTSTEDTRSVARSNVARMFIFVSRICEAPPLSYGRSTFHPRHGTWCPRVKGRVRGRVRCPPSTITPL